MLSAAQLALACSVPGNGYNVVLGAATLMLAANPFYLYDLSFQLSFMAVLSILFFYPRLYRRKLCRNRIADGLFVRFYGDFVGAFRFSRTQRGLQRGSGCFVAGAERDRNVGRRHARRFGFGRALRRVRRGGRLCRIGGVGRRVEMAGGFSQRIFRGSHPLNLERMIEHDARRS